MCVCWHKKDYFQVWMINKLEMDWISSFLFKFLWLDKAWFRLSILPVLPSLIWGRLSKSRHQTVIYGSSSQHTRCLSYLWGCKVTISDMVSGKVLAQGACELCMIQCLVWSSKLYVTISIDGLQKIRLDQFPNEASHRASKTPFPKGSLRWSCSQLGVSCIVCYSSSVW